MLLGFYQANGLLFTPECMSKMNFLGGQTLAPSLVGAITSERISQVILGIREITGQEITDQARPINIHSHRKPRVFLH